MHFAFPIQISTLHPVNFPQSLRPRPKKGILGSGGSHPKLEPFEISHRFFNGNKRDSDSVSKEDSCSYLTFLSAIDVRPNNGLGEIILSATLPFQSPRARIPRNLSLSNLPLVLYQPRLQKFYIVTEQQNLLSYIWSYSIPRPTHPRVLYNAEHTRKPPEISHRRANGWISRYQGIEIHVSWRQGRRKFPLSNAARLALHIKPCLKRAVFVLSLPRHFSPDSRRGHFSATQIFWVGAEIPLVLGCILRLRRSHQVFL